MKKVFAYISFCLFAFLGQAQNTELEYYLPSIEYDQSITTPEAFFGFQIGDWHVSHDKLSSYMALLAQESPRITIDTYAFSHENRPLQLLTISSISNQGNIANIKKEHVALTDAKQSPKMNIDEMPIVIYQGYSVHGNESSGANAAMLVAYYLAAGQSKEVLDLLDNSIILLDPCYNPDGFHRFSSWVNMHKSKNLVTDPNDLEYNETWPGGRTNHYWFDLNRDWLLLTHPESRGRIENFQEWKPNILTDHHEMGTNSTFFFQPGVPERTNPNTPQLNQDLTEQIGHYHAKALDEIGSLYYTKESFDDFYYGKGSTYPDIQGSIGILFEQASSRGHAQESVNGVLKFPFTIRNQVVTSLSTQEAAMALKKEILSFQRDFYQDASKEVKKNPVKSYRIPKTPDFNKAAYFVDILRQHDIQIYDDQKETGFFMIPLDQRQSKLIHTIFERVLDFRVNIFYDVSAWTFPLAFDLDVDGQNSWSSSGMKLITECPKLDSSFPEDEKLIGYAVQWNDWKAATLIGRLLKKGIKCISIHEDIVANTTEGEQKFGRGSVFFPKKDEQTKAILKKEAQDLGINIYGVLTGFNAQGIMLGSPSTHSLQKVNAMMIVGPGINSYDAGEIWYQMDQRLELPLSKIDINRLSRAKLDRYNVIIMPDGNYRRLDKKSIKNIEGWVRKGGNLISFKRAINTLTNNKLVESKKVERIQTEYKGLDYGDSKEKSAEHVIGGAIFNTTIDLSYPLFYGYKDESLAVFKKGTLALTADESSLANPMIYAENPLLSGYASKENIDRIKNSAGLVVYGLGQGKIICSVDNPLFRGYWIGGNRLFDNMLYHTSAIGRKGLKD